MSSAFRATNPPAVFHARHEHGGHPVHILGESFEVHWPAGVQTYPSARQLVKALYNKGDTSKTARDPGMTFARYFKTNKIGEDEAGPTVFDLFSSTPLSEPRLARRPRVAKRTLRARPQRSPASAGRWYRGPVLGAAFTTLALFGSPEIAEAKSIAVEEKPFAWADTPEQLSIEKPATTIKGVGQALSVAPIHLLGIDLAARGHEVRKLLYKGFGGRISRKGFEIEDVLQEVYKGLIARNNGKCPWDARISSFGHYVHMVCGCILSNYERKMARRREFEQTGMYVTGGSEDGGMVDAALGASNFAGRCGSNSAYDVEESAGTARAFSSLLSVLDTNGRDRRGKLRPEADLATKCLPLVYQGHQRADIARILGEDPSKVGRALSFLRKSATVWKGQAGLA
jgi:hypothetical protein